MKNKVSKRINILKILSNIYIFVINFTINSFLRIGLIRKRKPVYDLNNINNILISNNGHLGDSLYVLQIIYFISRKLPKARIDLLTNSSNIPVYKKSPINKSYYIDHWKVNRKNGLIILKIYSFLIRFIKLFFILQKKKYDLIIDSYFYYPNNILFLSLLNPSYLIGFSGGGYEKLCNFYIKYNRSDNLHIFEYYKTLLNHINLRLTYDNKIYLNLFDKVNLCDLNLPRKYIIIQPCSGDKIRELTVGKWINFINQINNNGFYCVFLGIGKREDSVINQIINGLEKKQFNTNLCDKLNWNQYLSIISDSIYVIGIESFACHLASALKVNNLMIKTGITNDATWKPYDDRFSQLLRYKTKCYPCLNSLGCKQMSCINNISKKNFIKTLDRNINN